MYGIQYHYMLALGYTAPFLRQMVQVSLSEHLTNILDQTSIHGMHQGQLQKEQLCLGPTDALFATERLSLWSYRVSSPWSSGVCMTMQSACGRTCAWAWQLLL